MITRLNVYIDTHTRTMDWPLDKRLYKSQFSWSQRSEIWRITINLYIEQYTHTHTLMCENWSTDISPIFSVYQYNNCKDTYRSCSSYIVSSRKLVRTRACFVCFIKCACLLYFFFWWIMNELWEIIFSWEKERYGLRSE